MLARVLHGDVYYQGSTNVKDMLHENNALQDRESVNGNGNGGGGLASLSLLSIDNRKDGV